MPLVAGAAEWLASTPLSQAMRGSLWLYPVVETVHIFGFAVLVGAVALFDLRVLGCARTLPVRTLGRHLLRWALASLLLVVPAGALLFASQPLEFIANPVFRLKLALLAAAGLNAACFHAGVYRNAAAWDVGHPAPPLARAQAALSLLLWVALITCGRMLAYV
ncbi:hypothetical protein ASD15_23990 [Massilia sp. Root351]|jgi:hypothetical protein|uniref:hypothetical protein n=1 Tax=Massilia sp. Root351 TaxID=1736522 RepID=UPI00070BDECE|nr:hypothetical protein [Massilia sp. Root351]KQV90364.1 hypothetical protein ASD15_23990 [Massilia sp. Root351]